MPINVRGSDRLKNFIKESESFSPKPYDDLGVPAIGYGQRNFDPNVTEVDEPTASKMLDEHLQKLEQEVGKRINRNDLSQSQIDAIMDASYNMGVEKLENEYNFFSRVNSGDNEDIQNFFKTANKARVGGKLQPLPGLVKRANQRAEWWNDSSEQAIAGDPLDDALENAMEGATDPSDDLIQESISTAMSDTNPDLDQLIDGAISGAAGEEKASGSAINTAADISDFSDFDYVNQAASLARKIGVSQADAEVALLDDSYENIMVRHESDILARSFPRTAQFMSVPEDYPLIARDLESAKKLEVLTRPQTYEDDLKHAFRKNAVTAEKYANILMLSTGAMTPEDYAKQRTWMEMEGAQNQYKYLHEKQIKRLAIQSEISEKKVAEAYRAFDEALDRHQNMKQVPGQEDVEAVKALISAGYVTVESLVDRVIAISENTEGWIVTETESLIGTLSGYAGALLGVGGGLATAGPAGIPAGAFIGASTATGIFSYAEKIDSDIEKAREEAGKDFDMVGYLRSPEFKEVEKAAKIYAGIQGTFEGVSTLTLGLFTKGIKEAAKAPIKESLKRTILKKAASVPTGIVKEGASQAAQEGAQQFSSNLAHDVYLGRTSSEDLAENVVDSVLEVTGAFGPGAVAGTGVGYSMKLLSKTAEKIPTTKGAVQDQARKIAPTLKKSAKAIDQYAKATKISEAIRDFKQGEFKGKLEDYVRSLLKKEKVERVSEDIPSVESIDEERVNPTKTEINDETISQIKEEPDTATVDVRLANVLLEQMGISPEQFYTDMGDSVYEQYKAIKTPRRSLVIPAEKWYMAVAEFPELHAIAKFSGNEFNALEAEQIKEAINEEPTQIIFPQEVEVPQQPDRGEAFILKQEGPPKEGEEGAKTTGEKEVIAEGEVPYIEEPEEQLVGPERAMVGNPPTVEQLEAEGAPEETILRQVETRSRFKNQDERDTFSRIGRQLRAATNKKHIEDEVVQMLTEVQFQHIKNRAAMLGKEVKDVADENYFTSLTKAEEYTSWGLGGYFSRTPGRIFNSFIAIRKSKTTIGSVAKANVVLHELGHLWLHEMAIDWDYIHSIPESLLSPEQKEYKFAMEALSEDFGMENLKVLADFGFSKEGEESLRAIHEKFAQTTEKYFLEGKFKNSKMKKALESLRKYLVKFAQIIGRGYPQYPALAIDTRMERIFEAIVGGTEKSEEMAYQMFPNLPFDPEILGPDGEKIVEAIQQTYGEQVSEVYQRVHRRTLKKYDETNSAFEDAARAEAEENIKDTLFAELRRGMDESYNMFKDPENTEVTEDPRISFESVVEFLFNGDEEQAAFWKRNNMRRQFIGGKKKATTLSVEQLMAVFDIGDTQEMITLLENASNYEFYLEREINRVLKRMNPPLKTDEQIHQEVLDVMATYEKDVFIRKSIQIMSEKALPQFKKLVKKGMKPAKYMKNAMDKNYVESKAMEFLAERKFMKSSPNSILNESQSSGSVAADRFAKGQFFDAFEAKMDEAIKFRAFQIAQKVSKDITRTQLKIANIAKMKPKTLAKTHDVDMIKYLRIVTSMVFPKKGPHDARRIPDLSPDMLFNIDLISQDQIDMINESKKRWQDQIGQKQPADMTVTEYAMYLNWLKNIMNVARGAKEILIEGRKYKAQAVAQETAKLIRSANKKVAGSVQNFVYLNAANADSLLQGLIGPEKYFGSKIQKSIKELQNASSVTEFEFNEARNRIIGLLSKLEKQDRDFRSIKGIARELNPWKGKKPKPLKLKNSKIVLENGVHDLIGILLNMGNNSNIEKLARGGFGPNAQRVVTVEDFNFVTNSWDLSRFQKDLQELADQGTITQAHFDFVQGVFDEFSKIFPKAKRAIRRVDGYEIGEIAPVSFKTPFGTMKGGYYPIVYKDAYEMRTGGDSNFSPDSGNMMVKDYYPNQNKGFENTRLTIKDQPSISADIGLLTYHLQNQYKVGYLREAAYFTGKILGNDFFKNAVEEKVPKSHQQLFKKWYDRVLNQQHTEYNGDDIVNLSARFARVGSNIRVFLGNTWSVAKQFIGWAPAARFAGKGLVNSITAMISKENREYMEKRADKMSPFMRNRRKEFARSIGKSIEELEVGATLVQEARQLSERYAYIWIQAAQNFVDIAVWDAVYDKSLSEKKPPATAAALADNAVKQSQGSTAIEDITNLQFGTDIKKLFTQFMTPAVGQFQQIMIFEMESRGLPITDRVKVMAPVFLMTSIIPGLILGLISQIRYGDDDDDLFSHYLHGVAKETVGNVMPFGGQSAYALVFEGKGVKMSPTLDILTRETGSARKGITNKAQGVSMTSREFEAVMSMATMATGVGFSGIGELSTMIDGFASERKQKATAKRRKKKLKILKDREK